MAQDNKRAKSSQTLETVKEQRTFFFLSKCAKSYFNRWFKIEIKAVNVEYIGEVAL